MTPERRAQLIEQYRSGPDEFDAALAEVPAEALDWIPAQDEWSIRQIVLHCADAEAVGYARVRMLMAEPSPLIVSYDQDRWATCLDYATVPIGPALSVICAVRELTSILLDTLPAEAWTRTGHHTESGAYSADDWLTMYGAHLLVHVIQIRETLRQWQTQASRSIQTPFPMASN